MATETRTRATRAWRALVVTVVAAACTHVPSIGPLRDITSAYTAQVVNPDLIGGLRIPHSNVVLLWGSDGSILRSSNARDWQYASTPIATDLTRAASDARGGTLIAVGKHGAALRSNDAGRTWRTVLNAGTDIDLKAVVHHPVNSTWLVAGTNGALFRSLDTGETWVKTRLPLTGAIETLFVDPATNAVLFGAEGGVVGRSLDGGESWELTGVAMPAPTTPITRFFRDESLLISLSALGRLLTSTDDGATWHLVESATRAYFTDIALDARHQSLVLIGHDATILRSIDRGRSWTTVSLPPESSRNYLSSVSFDERSQSLIVVGHGGVLARSADGGASWQRIGAPAPGNFEGLVQSGATLTVFGSGGSIITSTDADRHWRESSNALALYLRDVAAVPGTDALIATGQLGEIIRSHDGIEWRRIAVEYPDEHTPPDLRALTASANGDGLIAAGPPGAILRSSAAADRWEIVRWHTLDAGRAYPWILKDRSRNAVVALDARGAMQVSTDDGVQWQEIDAGLDGEFWHGAVLERSGVMIAAGKGGVAALSRTNGTSWSSVITGTQHDLFGSYADEPSHSFFLMGQSGTLLRSVDGGLSWTILDSGTRTALRRMIRDPGSGALICFGGNGVILRSPDGVAWQRVDSGVDAELRKSIVDPGDDALLIAGRSGVVLRSIDGGERWQRLPTHTQRHFTSIAARPNGDLVAVGERIVYLRRNSR